MKEKKPNFRRLKKKVILINGSLAKDFDDARGLVEWEEIGRNLDERIIRGLLEIVACIRREDQRRQLENQKFRRIE